MRILAFLTLLLGACAPVSQSASAQTPPPIMVDQFGYLPALQKVAVIKDPKLGFDAGLSFSPGNRYAVVNRATGKVVYTGQPTVWKNGKTDEASGDRIWHFDFSSVRAPGRYVIRDVDRRVESFEFEISSNVYTPVLKTAFKTMYLQRAGFEKRAPYAPRGFSDRASHLPSRYGPPNTSATVASAGAFAMAARVYRDVPGFQSDAKRYASRANKAWRWSEANPNVKFWNNDPRSNSEGLAAGQQEVEADRFANKKLIAAIHMATYSEDAYFHRMVEQLYGQVKPMEPGIPNGYEATLAFDMLYYARQSSTPKSFANRIRRDYQSQLLQGYNGWPAIAAKEDPYRAHVDGYWWGSNSVKSHRGQVYVQAIHAGIGEERKLDYLNAALGYVNYLHGVNPLNKVYLSNMGGQGAENSVTQFYHNWFQDGSDWDEVGRSKFGPAPGFLVGGPNDGYARDECCDTVCGGYGKKLCETPIKSPPAGQPPAKSYADFNEGWPINSWSVTENSNSYQIAYIRLLSKFAR